MTKLSFKHLIIAILTITIMSSCDAFKSGIEIPGTFDFEYMYDCMWKYSASAPAIADGNNAPECFILDPDYPVFYSKSKQAMVILKAKTDEETTTYKYHTHYSFDVDPAHDKLVLTEKSKNYCFIIDVLCSNHMTISPFSEESNHITFSRKSLPEESIDKTSFPNGGKGWF